MVGPRARDRGSTKGGSAKTNINDQLGKHVPVFIITLYLSISNCSLSIHLSLPLRVRIQLLLNTMVMCSHDPPREDRTGPARMTPPDPVHPPRSSGRPLYIIQGTQSIGIVINTPGIYLILLILDHLLLFFPRALTP